MNTNQELKWHWAVERVSNDRYCVYDTNTGVTLSSAPTMEQAIQDAHERPLTEDQQKYAPRFAHNFLVDLNNALREYDENFEFHPRAAKLMIKRKQFIVIANDEPYYLVAYLMIRENEKARGTWNDEDERVYQAACAANTPTEP